MLTKLNPDVIMAPFNDAYHHVVEIPAHARVVHIAGQVGLRPDGTLPDTLEAQADQAWSNVMACLAAAGMGAENVVKINAYLIDAAEYPAFAAARSKYLGQARPASTAVLVAQLIRPEWRFEIDAVAAAPG